MTTTQTETFPSFPIYDALADLGLDPGYPLADDEGLPPTLRQEIAKHLGSDKMAALACAILGRSFVGCELDEAWATASTERVRLYQEEGKLSDRDAERFSRYVEAKKVRPVKAKKGAAA